MCDFNEERNKGKVGQDRSGRGRELWATNSSSRNLSGRVINGGYIKKGKGFFASLSKQRSGLQ